jgi:hypothetical protein
MARRSKLRPTHALPVSAGCYAPRPSIKQVAGPHDDVSIRSCEREPFPRARGRGTTMRIAGIAMLNVEQFST